MDFRPKSPEEKARDEQRAKLDDYVMISGVVGIFLILAAFIRGFERVGPNDYVLSMMPIQGWHWILLVLGAVSLIICAAAYFKRRRL